MDFRCICVNVNMAPNFFLFLFFLVFNGRLVFKSEGEQIWMKHSGLVFELMFLQSQHLLNVWVLPSGWSVQLHKRQKLICWFFFLLTSIHHCSWCVCFKQNFWSKKTIFSTIKHVYQQLYLLPHCLVMHSVVAFEIFKMTFLCVYVWTCLFFLHMYVCTTYLCVWGPARNRSFIIVKRHWFSHRLSEFRVNW